MWPDLVILLNARTWFSGVGILLIVGGTWQAERAYDEQSSKDLTRDPEKNAYQAPAKVDGENNNDNNDDDADNMTLEKLQQDYHPTKLSAMGVSWIALGGWALLAFSYFLQRHQWIGFDVHPLVIIAAGLCVCVGVVQTVVLRRHMLKRDMSKQTTFFAVTLGLGMLVVGMLTTMIARESPVWAAPMGAAAVALSPVLLWTSRKRGEAWDLYGRVNNAPVLFNLGGPLLVFGWYWFFIGHNAVGAVPDNFYVPIYLSSRTMVAYVGVCAVTLVIWSASYALDELPDSEEGTLDLPNSTGFGLAGYFFGTVSEIKLAMMLAWMLLATAALLPYFGGVLPLFLFLSLLGLGAAFCGVYERGLRSGDAAKLKWWLNVGDVFLVASVVLLGLGGWVAASLAVAGTLGLGCGQYVMHQDRKRGKQWMETKSRKSSPIVYSYGIPIYTIGILLIGWSLSIPHHL